MAMSIPERKSETRESVGIDGLAVYVPRLYIDLTGEWAQVRAAASGVEPSTFIAKLTKGIGVRSMAIPDAHEDSATMAAMAVRRLIDTLGIDPASIGYLAVATETSVDQSKSIAAYVLGMLERYYGVSLSHTGCPQFQFACIGASYALEAAAALVRSGALEDRCAIVVATDIARYAMNGPAECTQGAGAVAMRVSSSPRLLEIDPGAQATISVDERDFFRPNWSSEAVVDGKYSIDLYLDCLDKVVRLQVARHLARGGNPATALRADHYLFHTPFPRMAEHAAARLYRRLLGLANGVGMDGWDRDRGLERDADRATVKSDAFRAWFDTCCAPALAHAPEIGNIYSGALYLSLASLIESASRAPAAAVGKRVAFFSYGSGASAKLFFGTICPTFMATAHATQLSVELAARPAQGDRPRRRALTLAEYESLHRLHMHAGVTTSPVLQPGILPAHDEFALLRYGNESSSERTDTGYRYYDFVEARSEDWATLDERGAAAQQEAVVLPHAAPLAPQQPGQRTRA
jgi:hydroxymethylglutaryl-CoA synthase